MVNQAAAKGRLERLVSGLLPGTWLARWTWDLGATGEPGRPDALLVLAPPSGKQTTMAVEVKSRLVPGELLQQIGRYQGDRLLVAPRLSERVRALLDRAGISWIDLRGDCRIVAQGVLIDRRGTAPREDDEELSLGSRLVADLFSGKALRIVRWLVIDPDRRWGVADMARRAEASPGFVSRTFRTLERDAYVRRTREGIALADGDGLLDAWATAPGPAERREEGVSLAGRTPDVLRQIAGEAGEDPLSAGYALTAEAAAEQLAPFARFSRVEMYVRDADRWRRSLRLTPVPVGGNVVLINSADPGVLDGVTVAGGFAVVSLPQLYVDLQRRAGASDAAAFLRQRLDKLRRVASRDRSVDG